MKLYLKNCIEKLDEEEYDMYANDTATNYFRYIQSTDKYKEVINKFYNKNNITREDWIYMFEKLYLTTYKSLHEEKKIHVSDAFTYIVSKIGMFVSPYDSLQYRESSRVFELIRTIYRCREINDFLLKALHELMQEYDVDDLLSLIKLHEEACILRNNRDYFYRLSNSSEVGIVSHSELEAINSFNRSYEREKQNMANYKVLVK